MSKKYKISQLIMNNENPYYRDEESIKNNENPYYRDEESIKNNEIKEIHEENKIRYLTWVDQKNIKSIKTPEGRELTPEELFNFVIGNNITDLARTKNISENSADIAIVLGNIGLPTTRERAIKAFELYKLGLVKKIIFTGGISSQRYANSFMHPKSLKEFMDNNEIKQKWSDLTEADWGAETFIQDVFYEDYQEHLSKLTEKFLRNTGINPEDVLTEALSTTTQENAQFCKNIFDSEELETGTKINSAIIVTTCTHGNRAMMQFKKVFGDKINFRWCPSTLDLEQYETLNTILRAPNFDEIAFRNELKRIYCTVPELTQMLREKTGNYRNVFITNYIDEPEITTIDKERTDDINR